MLQRIPAWVGPVQQAAVVPFVRLWQAGEQQSPSTGVAVQAELAAPPSVDAIVDIPTARSEADLFAACAAAAASGSAGDASVLQTVPSQYQGIHNRHNYYRSLHGTPALVWSTTLASSAANYAAKCQWGHDPNNQGQGENLYGYSATGNTAQSLLDAIKAW